MFFQVGWNTGRENLPRRHRCLVHNALTHWQAMELVKQRLGITATTCCQNHTSCVVLHSLGLRTATQCSNRADCLLGCTPVSEPWTPAADVKHAWWLWYESYMSCNILKLAFIGLSLWCTKLHIRVQNHMQALVFMSHDHDLLTPK